MKLSPRDILRLEAFLTAIQSETYPEPPSPAHTQITHRAIERVTADFALKPGARVLDVGCGQGVALEAFAKLGFATIGITVNATDLEACRAKGFDVRAMDQSFLDFEDGSFDLVWCRHCLEHSIMPLFTLSQHVRVLKPGTGGLYVEVPAPDTICAHQTNRNHYSMLPNSAWQELIMRSGVTPLQWAEIPIQFPSGIDRYWAFWGPRAR